MSLNPLFWLHLRIGGTTRTNIFIVATYVAIVVVGTAVSYYVAAAQSGPKPSPQTFAVVDQVWLIVLTVAQAVFLLLLAPAAIRRAVQRDFDSGMIESHRLSPMSSLKIVLGYLTGAPIQAMLLYAVSLVFGTYFATRYALSPGLGGKVGLQAALSGWYFAQGCMLVLAAMVGANVLLTSLATKGKGNIVGLMVVIGLFGGWVAVFFVPGLALLLGVLSAATLVGMIGSAKLSGDPLVLVYATVLQFVFCVIMMAAACGKLRAPDRPLFSLRLGWILLLVWGFTLVAGIYGTAEYDWLFEEWAEYGYAQLLSSTATFMLFALFPLVAAAVGLFHGDRAATFVPAQRLSGRLVPRLVPLALAALTVVCMFLMFQGFRPGQLSSATLHALERWLTWVPIVVTVVWCYWISFNWVYFLAATGCRMLVGLLVMFLGLNLVPLGLDGLADLLSRELVGQEWTGYGYLTCVSPIGTLMLAPQGGMHVWVGLLVQGVIAAGATLLGRRARRSLGREESPPPADETVVRPT